MSYLRQNGNLVFTSSREVITHYTALIDELTPQLQGITADDYQAIRVEIADLRRQLVDQMKNFGYSHVDEYFSESMANAESNQEYYKLSNAYEAILVAELSRIKEKLHTLRIT